MDEILKKRCENCAHSHPFELKSEHLQCRKNPPMPFVSEDGYYVWSFPCVTPYIYCGEFREKRMD